MDRSLTPELARRFERDVLPHVDAAYRMARSLTRGDADRSDDLVQDATLKALRAYPTLEDHRNLRSWFVRIVHTTFLDRVRSDRRRPTTSIDDEDGPDEAAFGFVEFEPSVFEQGLDDDYEAALAELPDSWRAVVQLVDVEGHSYEEAATMLDLPVGTVRSRLHRSRQKLYVEICRRLRLGWCEELDGLKPAL